MEEITHVINLKKNNHTSENKIKIHNGKIKQSCVSFHNQEQKKVEHEIYNGFCYQIFIIAQLCP